MEWHLKGVFSLEDGLYAIWSYKGHLSMQILWSINFFGHTLSFPLFFPLYSASLFFPVFFLFFPFFWGGDNSEKAYSGTSGGKAAQNCLTRETNVFLQSTKT